MYDIHDEIDKYRWNPKFNTGYREIDENNRYLIKRLNDIFIFLLFANEPITKLAIHLSDLIDFTALTLEGQELLMLRIKYPNVYDHINLHYSFIQAIQELKNAFAKLGPSEQFIVLLMNVYGNWLINHINNDDINIARYIESTSINLL